MLLICAALTKQHYLCRRLASHRNGSVFLPQQNPYASGLLGKTPTAIGESPRKEMACGLMVLQPIHFDNSNEAMAKETIMFSKILVAVDETEQAQWALEAAINLARVANAELTLVHVIK